MQKTTSKLLAREKAAAKHPAHLSPPEQGADAQYAMRGSSQNSMSDSRVIQPRFAMARAVLILEEGPSPLKEPLQKKRFKVQVMPTGISDAEFAERLAHRIFVTSHAEDLMEATAIE